MVLFAKAPSAITSTGLPPSVFGMKHLAPDVLLYFVRIAYVPSSDYSYSKSSSVKALAVMVELVSNTPSGSAAAEPKISAIASKPDKTLFLNTISPLKIF